MKREIAPASHAALAVVETSFCRRWVLEGDLVDEFKEFFVTADLRVSTLLAFLPGAAHLTAAHLTPLDCSLARRFQTKNYGKKNIG